jgi:transcriptional regulator with XRE-family HTH domain
MSKKTNFDEYLEEQLKDPEFAERFERAGKGWELALQIAALRQKAGLSQKELAKLLGTSQQQVSRLESPEYHGHSLNTLQRLAEVLNAKLRVEFQPMDDVVLQLAEPEMHYQTAKEKKKEKVG